MIGIKKFKSPKTQARNIMEVQLYFGAIYITETNVNTTHVRLRSYINHYNVRLGSRVYTVHKSPFGLWTCPHALYIYIIFYIYIYHICVLYVYYI